MAYELLSVGKLSVPILGMYISWFVIITEQSVLTWMNQVMDHLTHGHAPFTNNALNSMYNCQVAVLNTVVNLRRNLVQSTRFPPCL